MKTLRQALRRHLSPLGADTVSMLNLPKVRMGLLAKLNLLTVGLIFLTAVTVTAFHFTQQWRDEEQQLRVQGASLMGIMAELAEYALYTSDRQHLDQMLDSIGADPEVAFVSVQDLRGNVLSERRFAPALASAGLPAMAVVAATIAPGTVSTRELDIGGHRYVELAAPVTSPRPSPHAFASNDERKPAADAAPVGLIRLGMTLEPQRRQFRQQMVGAIGVVALLVEGGAELAGTMIASRTAHRMHAFVAPLLLGPRGRPGAVDWAGPDTPAEAPRIADPSWECCGHDAYVFGRLEFQDRA